MNLAHALIMIKNFGARGMAGLGILTLLAFPFNLAKAQQEYAPEDTIDYDWGEYDEYYEGEYYDEYSDEGYFEEDTGYGGEEDYYYEDEGGYLEEDVYYDDEGFDETLDEEFLEDIEPEEGVDDLELADDQAGEVELQEIEQKKIREPRVIRGYTAKLSVASPFMAGLGFDPFWHSYIDYRVTLDLPRKVGAGPLAPSYALEVATFSFENQHPRGGEFSGVALLAMMRFPLGPLKVSAGGGMFASGSDVRGGLLFGGGYTIPFIRFIDLTIESRLIYVQEATLSGAAYWLDVGGSLGYRF
ncbi:MAG: hypothetical protein ACETWG_10315 [Candidatus Neomarinimicrobiota bacterium]